MQRLKWSAVSILVVCVTLESGFAGELVTAAIGGVRIGDSRIDLRHLGDPSAVRDTGDALTPEWTYANGLAVLFWDDGDQVAEVRSESPTACTDTGVCPGAAASQLDKLLGPDVRGQFAGDGIHQYPAADDTCWLHVAVRAAQVTAIALKCQL